MDHSFSTIALLLLLPLTYLIFAAFRTPRRRHKNSPEPGNAWPVIGHLRVLSGPNVVPHRVLAVLAETHGPVFSLRIGLRHRAVVVSSPELAKELLTGGKVLNRPTMTSYRYLTYGLAMTGPGPHGAYWRHVRKIQVAELLSTSRLTLHRHFRESEVERSIRDLHRTTVVEMKSWVRDLTMSLMLRMIVGESSTTSSSSSAVYRRFMAVTREFFSYMVMVVVRDAIPCLGWMDIGGHEKGMKRVGKELDGYLEGWLAQHKEEKKKKMMKNPRSEPDFMDVLLSVLDEGSLHGRDRDTVVKATCLEMISGGTETTVGTTTWAIALLLNHPAELRKVQEELDRCVSRERAVTEGDIEKLVYLQAVLKESMRLHPVAAIPPAREFTDDCDVGGYRVEKGTWLMVNAWKIYTDPNVWPDPTEFKPERFLTTHKHVDVKGQSSEFFPFGSGRRACPGMNLGLQMALLMLASFLHAFGISTPGGAPVDMREGSGMANMIAAPLDVVVAPRLSPEVYAG